jgi:hypothetical protein
MTVDLSLHPVVESTELSGTRNGSWRGGRLRGNSSLRRFDLPLSFSPRAVGVRPEEGDGQ